MYIQQKFCETRIDELHTLIRAYPLGTLVMQARDGLDANHMPFHLDTSTHPQGVLRGHLPKANPLWQETGTDTQDALVIFQGPQAYITPSWYPSKRAHGQAVPTWNYAVVHVHGRPAFIEDHAWLRAHVETLTRTHEAGRHLPWQVSDAPEDYIARMLDLIVGIEIPIDRLLGKMKVSQNRPPADRLGVLAGLHAQHGETAAAMADLVGRYHDPARPADDREEPPPCQKP